MCSLSVLGGQITDLFVSSVLHASGPVVHGPNFLARCYVVLPIPKYKPAIKTKSVLHCRENIVGNFPFSSNPLQTSLSGLTVPAKGASLFYPVKREGYGLKQYPQTWLYV